MWCSSWSYRSPLGSVEFLTLQVMTNPVRRFDFTLKIQDAQVIQTEAEKVKESLRKFCSKWVFQAEEGDSGYKHFQGRISSRKKIRLSSLCNKNPLEGAHWSVTSSALSAGDFDYVTKEDGRIAGPWKDTDPRPPPLTRQLRNFLGKQLYPWQESVRFMAQLYDERSINVVLDTTGNIGKSIFCEYLTYKGLAFCLPPMRDQQDLMAVVIDRPASCYIVDMPRGMKKDKLGEFYSGLEAIKNGIAYDKRYKYRERRFDRPQVFVFTNTLPAFHLLSRDRWKLWEVNASKELVEMELPDP
jgi:hypothetical protein